MSETLLWPLEVGWSEMFTRTDSTGSSWTVKLEVVEEVIINSQKYFHCLQTNYDNNNEVREWNFYSTDKAVFANNPPYDDCMLLQIGPIGTSWTGCGEVTEIIAIESVTVPYGGPYQAYVLRKHEKLATGDSPYWYEYVVPGIGMVKEVDYWVKNAPTISVLANIIKSKGMPWLFLLLK